MGPADGVCPRNHQCTGKPYNAMEDTYPVDLKSTLGHAIRGRTSEIPHFTESAWWEPESGTQSVPVDYLFCLPLGKYSRMLVSGLYLSENKTVDLRSVIPINTRLLGFSIDLFISSPMQDFHVKLDTRVLCSLDASYIDAEQWLDLLQPFADRNEFPMLWPFYQLQRNKKKCVDKDIFDMLDIDTDFDAEIEFCVCYTWERELYFGLSVSIGRSFGDVTLAEFDFLEKEMHVATFHVKNEDDDPRLGQNQPLTGITTGDMKIVENNVCKNLNEERDPDSWEVAKQIVQLSKDQRDLGQQIKNLNKKAHDVAKRREVGS